MLVKVRIYLFSEPNVHYIVVYMQGHAEVLNKAFLHVLWYEFEANKFNIQEIAAVGCSLRMREEYQEKRAGGHDEIIT